MQKSRNCTSTSRRSGIHFLVAALCLIGFIYYTFTFVNIPVWGINLSTIGILSVFHIFFGLLLAAFVQAVATDPGLVPPNWGFYMGDETKRRRYCKMCNVWKPDRTHHCSICNRCVLNMDHHCPWINNCVGFYNRKYFMQLIFYVYVCLTFSITANIAYIANRVMAIAETHELFQELSYGDPCTILALCLSLVLIVALTNFIRFHLKLVNDNYTTIENLEREGNAKSRYDIGQRRNWEQVCGGNSVLWWLPMHTSATRPQGDGVRWRVHYTRVVDEDEDGAHA